MDEREFEQFLKSVRHQDFASYLQPREGESLPQALERRIQWAGRVRNSDRFGQEALFLLKNQQQLRQRVSQGPSAMRRQRAPSAVRTRAASRPPVAGRPRRGTPEIRSSGEFISGAASGPGQSEVVHESAFDTASVPSAPSMARVVPREKRGGHDPDILGSLRQGVRKDVEVPQSSLGRKKPKGRGLFVVAAMLGLFVLGAPVLVIGLWAGGVFPDPFAQTVAQVEQAPPPEASPVPVQKTTIVRADDAPEAPSDAPAASQTAPQNVAKSTSKERARPSAPAAKPKTADKPPAPNPPGGGVSISDLSGGAPPAVTPTPDPPAPTPAPEPPKPTGMFAGSWSGTVGGSSASAQLRQNGDRVSGTIAVDGTRYAVSGRYNSAKKSLYLKGSDNPDIVFKGAGASASNIGGTAQLGAGKPYVPMQFQR